VFQVNFTYNKIAPISEIQIKTPTKISLNANESAYFLYRIVKPPSNSMIYIRATPGGSKISVFGSNEWMYPSKENFVWSSKISNPTQSLWEDSELDPFTINEKNELEYKPVTALVDKKSIKKHDEECVALRVYGYLWKHGKKLCYLSIHNDTGEKLDCTLEVNEFLETELIPAELNAQFDTFAKTFQEIEGGSISQDERRNKKLVGSEFTYGEIELIHFLSLLRLASDKAGGVFWDLGCGAGKAIIAAAIGYNNFSKICGVELLDGLYDAAAIAVDKYCNLTGTAKDRFKLIKGDMTKVDWSDADVIYTSSICFPEPLIKAIQEIGKNLKKGTKIVTLKRWDDPSYRKICSLKVKMTWGKTGVYILEKI